MATTQDVVLVSSPDEDIRQATTNALRDRWPVRIASTGEATVASVDGTIGVLVVDEALENFPDDAIETQRGDEYYQVLWLGSAKEAPGDVDAVLDRDTAEDRLRTTVGRLQRRARYDRLLERFYELSTGSEDDLDGDRSRKSRDQTRERAALKREIDELSKELSDEDAFDVALRE